MNRAARGRKGEDVAVAFLEKHGYRVLARNFRCREGEIDIIARSGENLVFVEVKCWDAFSFADMEYALAGRKVKRLMKTARYYLHLHPGMREQPLRFDVVFISENLRKVHHIINAFSEV